MRSDRIGRQEEGERILTDLELLAVCEALGIPPSFLVKVNDVFEEIENFIESSFGEWFCEVKDFEQALSLEIPGWWDIFWNVDFREWLKISKSPHGEPLLLALKEGFEDRAVVEVVKVFKAYEKSKKELSWSFRCSRAIEREKREIRKRYHSQKRSSDPPKFQIISRGESRESKVQCSICKKPIPDNADSEKVVTCSLCVQVLLAMSKKEKVDVRDRLIEKGDSEGARSVQAFF